MSEQRDLALLLKSRFPLVVIETHEEARAVALLERICNQEQWPFHTWSIADGLRRRVTNDAEADTNELTKALHCIDQSLAMLLVMTGISLVAALVLPRLGDAKVVGV